jgi:hypothetical protein
MPTTAVPLTLTPVGAVADISGGTSIGLADQTGVTSIPSFTAIAGSAVITITPTFGGCVGVAQTTAITVPTSPFITGVVKFTDIYPGGYEFNSIVTGGLSPYNYNWYLNNVLQSGPLSNPLGEDFWRNTNAITAGSNIYKVEVIDSIGCSSIFSYPDLSRSSLFLSTTQQNDILPIVLSPFFIDGNGVGSINLVVSGSVPPYTILWNDGITTEDRSGLLFGKYAAIITDSIGVKSSISATILKFTATPLSHNGYFQTVQPSCQGSLTGGFVILLVYGGITPYTYLWSNGSTNINGGVSGLGAGTYSCVVTDNLGATVTISNIIITEPSILNINATSTNIVTINDGTISCAITGGVGLKHTRIIEGNSFLNTGYQKIIYSTNLDNFTVTGLSAGQYSIRTIDKNSCAKTQLITII